MALLAVCLIAAVVVIFILRKNMRFLSLIVIAEVAVLAVMLGAMGLTSLGVGGTAMTTFTGAMTSVVSVFGMRVSSLMLIQAVVILMVAIGIIYMLTAIVKKVLKCKHKKDIFKRKSPEKINLPRQSEARKVFKLYCRMNC